MEGAADVGSVGGGAGAAAGRDAGGCPEVTASVLDLEGQLSSLSLRSGLGPQLGAAAAASPPPGQLEAAADVSEAAGGCGLGVEAAPEAPEAAAAEAAPPGETGATSEEPSTTGAPFTAVETDGCGAPGPRPGAQGPPGHAEGPGPGPSGGASRLRVAGLDGPLLALRELVGWPSLYAWQGQQLGVRWPRGLLLHGPPGCGKTLLVTAVAEEFGAVVHTVTAATVFGAHMGESERRLREVFEAARADARAGRTAIVFLDEADALCPTRDGRRQHEARVVAQLLTLLDGADTKGPEGRAPSLRPQPQQQPQQGGGERARQGHMVVVAATNRPNALDPALRRPGRLDREVLVPVPDAAGRLAMLRLHTSGLTLAPGLDLSELATSCHGYSGADLAALAREAVMHAVSGVAKQVLSQPWALTSPNDLAPEAQAAAGGLSSLWARGVVAAADFQAAMKRVGPSIVRGAEVEVTPVRWEDVGGLPDVKKRLRQAVEWPLLHRASFQRLGLTPPRGVLLFGPPGCSKTTLARAAATASRATLLPLSCAQLFSMYVGEGEALLRDTFSRARMAAPSIIFLDEVDALAAKRSETEASHSSSLRLLSTLLTEMDGMELATGVLVLAATNRPTAIDAALMRPGRLEVQLYVPPPDCCGRLEVLRVHTGGMPLAADVDLAALAADTDRFSGAELAGLCREAAMAALREDLHGATQVADRHFRAARAAKRPSLTPQILRQYEELVAARRQAPKPAAAGDASEVQPGGAVGAFNFDFSATS